MSIAPTLNAFLDHEHVHYDLLPHPKAFRAAEIAHTLQTSEKEMAKVVIVKVDERFVPVAHTTRSATRMPRVTLTQHTMSNASARHLCQLTVAVEALGGNAPRVVTRTAWTTSKMTASPQAARHAPGNRFWSPCVAWGIQNGRLVAMATVSDDVGCGGRAWRRRAPWSLRDPAAARQRRHGDVYLARDRRLGRKVALKRLPPQWVGTPEVLRRFQREARLAAALNHPNIVTLYSVESEGDVHFLTMEFVEGESLAGEIPAGGMDLRRFLHIAVSLASALEASHRLGIAHRDLKPHNIMMTPDGRVKVLDFGRKYGLTRDEVVISYGVMKVNRNVNDRRGGY